jgi:hypothetical protein
LDLHAGLWLRTRSWSPSSGQPHQAAASVEKPIGITFSEWALCDPACWAYLSPILLENSGWAIFNGSPRVKNHAFRSFRSAQGNPDYFAEVVTAMDTDVFSAAQLEAEADAAAARVGEPAE